MADNPQMIEGTIGEATGLLRNIRKLSTRETDNFDITKSDAFATTLIENLKYVSYATIAIGAVTLIGAAIALMNRSEEHTSELQSLMRISYAVFCLKKKK